MIKNDFYLDKDAVEVLKRHYDNSRYNVPKWILFSEYFLRYGFEVFLHKSLSTKSKYLTLTKNKKSVKVRFAEHKPAKHRVEKGCCDYYVGPTLTGYCTARQVAIEIKREYGLVKNIQKPVIINHETFGEC